MRTIGIVALLVCVLLGAGCGLLGGAGIADNAVLKAAFVEKATELAAIEGIAVTEAELIAVYENGAKIAASPAAAAISEVVEGNADAKAKLEALLTEHLPKK